MVTKYISVDGEYVAHNAYGQTGPAVRCKQTGLLLATRQIGIEVSSGTYKFVSPEGTLPASGVDRLFSVMYPAKFGFMMFFKDDDTPTNVLSIAVSYYPSKSILIRCLKGSATVPKPYWASADTDGSETTVDGYTAYSLSEGQYVLFYDSSKPKPQIGSNKVAYADRYPKEASEPDGLTLSIDLTDDSMGIFSNPTVDSVTVALGFGPSILMTSVPGSSMRFFYKSDERAHLPIGFISWSYYREPAHAHNTCRMGAFYRPFYMDDSDASAGTWQDPPDLAGMIVVFEDDDGYCGFAFEAAQHRLSYAKVTELKAVLRFKFIDDELYVEGRFTFKSLMSHRNYDEGGVTVGVAGDLKPPNKAPGFTMPSSVSAFNGSSWVSLSLPGADWSWHTGYYAVRFSYTTDRGAGYYYGKLVKFYSSWATGITPKIALLSPSDNPEPPKLYTSQVADRDFSPGEVTGFRVEWRLGPAEDYEESPSSPSLETVSDHPDEVSQYFTGVLYQPAVTGWEWMQTLMDLMNSLMYLVLFILILSLLISSMREAKRPAEE